MNDVIKEPAMIDIERPVHGVEVKISQGRNVLWVNIDGICRLRCHNIEGRLTVIDPDAPPPGLPVAK